MVSPAPMDVQQSTSHGYSFGPDPIGELRDSSGLARRPDALRKRMAGDGYLLLRGALDPDQVLAARVELCTKLAAAGLLDRARSLTGALYSGSNAGLGQMDRIAFAHDLRTGPALRALLQDGRIISFYEAFLGGPVLPFSFIWVRTVLPGSIPPTF